MELEHVRIALSGLMIGLVLTVGARDDLAFFDYAISQTRPQTFVMSNGEILPFRYHAPEKVERGKMYPLVLLMHGAGSRGTNNVNQIRHGGTQLFDWARRRGEKFFFIAPQCPDGKQWVDVPWSNTSHRMKREPTPGLAGAFAIVNDVMRREPVDPSRVYVMGISMGGYATWELLQRRPGLFAGALPCCGGGDVHLAWKLRDIPIWAFHGSVDTTVPTSRSREMVAALWAVDGKIRYREYPGVAHNCWTLTFDDDSVFDWLFAQRRGEE